MFVVYLECDGIRLYVTGFSNTTALPVTTTFIPHNGLSFDSEKDATAWANGYLRAYKWAIEQV